MSHEHQLKAFKCHSTFRKKICLVIELQSKVYLRHPQEGRTTSLALLLPHRVGCWAAQHWFPCLLQLHHNLQKAVAHLRDSAKTW